MVTSNRATSPSLLSSILKFIAVGIKIPCCSFTGSYIYHLKQQSRRTNRSLSIWSVCVQRDSDLAASPAGKCSYTFHAHTAHELNRGTHSAIRTQTPVIHSPNYYVPEFFPPRAWTFQSVLSPKPSELATFSLRSLPSRAALKTTFLNSRPVAAILNSSPPPQTLKSPSLRSKLR